MAKPAVMIDDHATRVPSTRRVARYVAAGMALVAAVLYCLIALDVLHVMEVIDNAGRVIPALVAGAFVLGTLHVLFLDKRLIHVFDGLLQVIVIVGYFVVAPNRTPSYEVWGIVIKVVQVAALGALVYLCVRPRRAPKTSARVSQTSPSLLAS